MRRPTKLPDIILQGWLASNPGESDTGRYSHRCLLEQNGGRTSALPHLKAYCREALLDALNQILEIDDLSDISPFILGEAQADVFPGAFHERTLQGYFGETLAGLIAESFGSHGDDRWTVLAYLFRFHVQELQHLEQIIQILRGGGVHNFSANTEIRPGRTGDDCLAFIRDEERQLTHILIAEAKCTADHNATLISKAHESLSQRLQLTTSLGETIRLLLGYPGDGEAQSWITTLLDAKRRNLAGVDVLNGVFYVAGRVPKQKRTWMNPQAPHPRYTSNTPLEANELHLPDCQALIDDVYRTTWP